LKITIETGQWASRYVDSQTMSIDMPEQSTVQDALDILKIPEKEIGITAIDNKMVPKEHPLSDGDIIKVYTAIIGG